MTDESEAEKNSAYLLGHISMLEQLEEEFRDRAGNLWANDELQGDSAVAHELKGIADDLKDRRERRREEWEDRHGD